MLRHWLELQLPQALMGFSWKFTLILIEPCATGQIRWHWRIWNRSS
jgi:hypothetical protein